MKPPIAAAGFLPDCLAGRSARLSGDAGAGNVEFKRLHERQNVEKARRIQDYQSLWLQLLRRMNSEARDFSSAGGGQ